LSAQVNEVTILATSCLALNAVDKLALSVGCQVIAEKLVAILLFSWNIQLVQS